MPRKIIYLINPISGTKNKEVLTDLIRKKTSAAQIAFQIEPTEKDGLYLELQSRISKGNITDVVICGGDGSVNQVTAALRFHNITFGVIPVGSGNGLAFAARIPSASSKAIDIILAGKSAPIDAFMVNEHFSCMLSGVGFDANIAHDFANQKQRGLLTYLKQSFKNYINSHPYPFEISVNNVVLKTDAYFISIANSNQFGNHVTIAPKASLSDGLLDIVVVNKMNKLLFAYEIGKQIISGKVGEFNEIEPQSGIHYFQAKQLSIKNISMASMHVDGEPVPTAPIINVDIIKDAFRLLQP